jgi:hypothetical protein
MKPRRTLAAQRRRRGEGGAMIGRHGKIATMDLHRSHGLMTGGLLFVAVGAFILVRGLMPVTTAEIVLGAAAIAIGLGLIGWWRKPLPLSHIGPDGLRVHVGAIRRVIGWAEISAVVIDQPAASHSRTASRPHLLLVPAAADTEFDGLLDGLSPVDSRPCLMLLELEDVRETPTQVTAALAAHAGARFTDMRQVRARRFDAPRFTMVARGYDSAAVDELVRLGQTALATGESMQRSAVRAQIDGAKIPLSLRGYDRGQVDATFAVLSAELASFPEHNV